MAAINPLKDGPASKASFVVPTATFRVLFVLVVLAHEWRRVVHFYRDEQSDDRVDRAADGGGVSVRDGAALPLA
jgi:hypothetical protein